MAAALRILSMGKLFTVQPALKAVIDRSSPAILARGLSITSARAKNDFTDTDQSTGLEKKEYDALVAGIEDPFNLQPYEGPPGTKEKPLEILSLYNERIIGCICDPDTTYIMWKKLYLNETTRCACGHWFVLRRGNPTKLPIDVPLDPHH